MRDLFRRLGTWVAIGTVIMSQAAPGLILPAAAEELPINPAETVSPTSLSTTVVLNEFLSQSTGGGTQDYVELVNPTAVAVTITNWTIATATTTLVTIGNQTLNPGALALFSLPNQLNDAEETLILRNNAGAIVDQLRYGTSALAALKAPGAGKSAGRLPDGDTAWYSGFTPTPGAANGPTTALAIPEAVKIRAGNTNPENIINATSQSQVLVDIAIGSGGQASTTLTADLIDNAGTLRSGQVASSTVTSTQTVTLNLTQLFDGAITLRTYATTSAGVSSAYRAGPVVTKDTGVPSAPIGLAIAGTTGINATNIINAATMSAVKTSVTLPSTANATETVTVSLTDGLTTVSQTATTPAGGGSITVQTIGVHAINTSALNDGSTIVSARVSDAAGNTSGTVQTTAYKDTLAPAASLTINSGATVTTSGTVTLTMTASDVGAGVTEMMLSHASDFAGAAFEPFAASKTWTLTDGDGFKTVYLKVRDGALNSGTATQASIRRNAKAEAINLVQLASGTQTVRRLPSELDVTTISPTALTIANYPDNPGTALPTGLTGVTGFREIGIADPGRITFPIFMKIYYTDADLRAAGVVSESQLKGIAFFDQPTQTWIFYNSTGVNTADLTVDGQMYAGYLFANADHLTPMTGLADTTPPAAPENVQATAGNQEVSLSWSAVSDAASYQVRYRKATAASAAYTVVTLPASLTSTKVINLENDISYEFGIAARDSHGNTSSFTTMTATPATPAPTASQVTAPKVLAAGGPSSLQPTVTRVVREPSPTASPTPGATPTARPESDQTESRDLGRLLVTLAIILIAIGATLAGFYGWQWFEQHTARPLPPTTPPATPRPAGGPPAPGTPAKPLAPVVPTAPPAATPPLPPAAPPGSPPPPPASPPEPPAPPPPPAGEQPPKPPLPPEGRW